VKFFILILSLIYSPASSVLAAPTPVAAEKKPNIEQVDQAISLLQADRQHNQSRYDTLQTELQQNEARIASLSSSLQSLTDILPEKQLILQQLRQRWQVKQRQVKQQQTHLEKQVRAAYIMGRQDYLKILLNQQDPTLVGRVLTYYDYFNRARVQRIERYSQGLQELKQLTTKVENETRGMETLLQQQGAEKQQLQDNYQDRQQVLFALSETIETQDIALHTLQEDKKNLSVLVAKLPQVVGKQSGVSFPRLKHHLPRPVQGQIIHSYGQARGIGKLKWQGVLFAAKRGDQVHSVADGEVVFADWFRNLGYLLIIQHDKGYMSLYGHNRNLYKQKGEYVQQGEVISRVGDSGGQQKSGLYFELRRKGIPFNPRPWFQS